MKIKDNTKEILGDDLGVMLLNSFNIKDPVDKIEITIEPQKLVKIKVTYTCSENMGKLCKTLAEQVKNYSLVDATT